MNNIHPKLLFYFFVCLLFSITSNFIFISILPFRINLHHFSITDNIIQHPAKERRPTNTYHTPHHSKHSHDRHDSICLPVPFSLLNFLLSGFLLGLSVRTVVTCFIICFMLHMLNWHNIIYITITLHIFLKTILRIFPAAKCLNLSSETDCLLVGIWQFFICFLLFFIFLDFTPHLFIQVFRKGNVLQWFVRVHFFHDFPGFFFQFSF